jgi:tripartite-type tricarboxylate transporter receptor subunit TctC
MIMALRFAACRLAACRLAACGAAVLLTALAGSNACAQAPADFYRGKTIEININVSVGGGYDLYARMIARHLGKHIPGNPTILPKNMEGAGGMRLANWLYNAAPKDGTALGAVARATAFEPLLGNKSAHYDGRRFNYIGSANDEVSVCVAWHTSGVRTFEDAKKTQLVVGANGTSEDTYQYPALLNHMFGSKFKMVSGYPGGNDINLAMERGEVQGRATTWESWPSANPDWLRDKKIIQLVQLGPKKLPEIGDDVPLLRDLVQGEERAIVDFVGLSLAMGRSVFAPPGVPAERVAALRTALIETVKDPAYIADAKRLSLDTATWQTGEAVERVVKDAFSLPPALVQKAKAAMDLP